MVDSRFIFIDLEPSRRQEQKVRPWHFHKVLNRKTSLSHLLFSCYRRLWMWELIVIVLSFEINRSKSTPKNRNEPPAFSKLMSEQQEYYSVSLYHYILSHNCLQLSWPGLKNHKLLLSFSVWGGFLSITGWDPRVSKSNRLHVDIFRFSFI